MGKHIITVEVDTDRDIYGNTWGANFDGVPKHRDDEMRVYASTFGGEPGAQWDNPPHTEILSVEPVTPRRPFTIHHSAGGYREPPFGFWIQIDGEGVPRGPYDTDESAAIKQAFEDAGLSAEGPQPVEPAYTVVGTHDDGGEPYVVTVYTHNGPEAALKLAHEAHSEKVSAHSGELDPPELQVVAIFAGEPPLVDFDRPETWEDDGIPPCPECESHDVAGREYPDGKGRWRCNNCGHDFITPLDVDVDDAEGQGRR